MTTVQVEIPDSVLRSLRETPAQMARDIRLTAAIDWFTRGLLSQGRAAEIAGVSRREFLDELGRRGVPAINMSLEELQADLRDSLGEG